MIGAAIRTILTGDATVSALTSRVYPVIAPQNAAFPFIVYRRYTTDPEEAKATAGTLIMQGVEINIYSKSYDNLETIGEAVYDALLSYSGTTNGVNIHKDTLFQGEEEFWSEAAECYTLSQEYQVSYNKTS